MIQKIQILIPGAAISYCQQMQSYVIALTKGDFVKM